MEDAEKIFKDNGIEIIYKNDDTGIKYSDLTDEEKKTWVDENKKYSPKQILSSLNELHDKLGKHLLGIKTIFQLPDDVKHESFFDDYMLRSSVRNLAHEIFQIMSSRMRMGSLYYDSEVEDDNEVSCSVMIGKSGDSIIRFLEFRENDDPIVTITGGNMNPLKESLEKLF